MRKKPFLRGILKNKYILLGLAALLVSTALIGGSLATINAIGDPATNKLEAPTLGVDIDYAASGVAEIADKNGRLMPGDTLDCSGFVVANTAQVPLYARVTVTKYWTGADDKKDSALDAHLIEMSTNETGWIQANEVLRGNSGETEVYYLARPLASGETAKLPLELRIGEELTNAFAGTGITVKASVDAVQFVEGQNELNAGGILASFGGDAALNADGTIRSVTQ